MKSRGNSDFTSGRWLFDNGSVLESTLCHIDHVRDGLQPNTYGNDAIIKSHKCVAACSVSTRTTYTYVAYVAYLRRYKCDLCYNIRLRTWPGKIFALLNKLQTVLCLEYKLTRPVYNVRSATITRTQLFASCTMYALTLT